MAPVTDPAPPPASPQRLVIRDLGLQPYIETWHRMRDFSQQRGPTTPDELWCLQHPPVFTQGQAGKAQHLLAPGDIPVVQCDRGGQVTYHGPGQLVIYLLLDIRRLGLSARALVSTIEQSLINVLGQSNIPAQIRDKAPGVYTDKGKIASLGLRIKRGCSYHGLALNLDMDLSPFNRINPCGYSGMAMTQVRDYQTQPVFQQWQQRLLAQLQEALAYTEVETVSESSHRTQ